MQKVAFVIVFFGFPLSKAIKKKSLFGLNHNNQLFRYPNISVDYFFSFATSEIALKKRN